MGLSVSMGKLSDRWFVWGGTGALLSVVWLAAGAIAKYFFAGTIAVKAIYLISLIVFWPCVALGGIASNESGSYEPLAIAVFLGFPVMGFIYGVAAMAVFRGIARLAFSRE